MQPTVTVGPVVAQDMPARKKRFGKDPFTGENKWFAAKQALVPTSVTVWSERVCHFRSFHIAIFIADSNVFTMPTI